MRLINIKKKLANVFYQQNLHFFVIWLCLLMQMFNWAHLYRFFAHINLLMVLIYGLGQLGEFRDFKNKNVIFYVISIPLLFIAIHFFAIRDVVFTKEIRHIYLATFLALGIWILAAKSRTFIKKNIFGFTLALVFIYVAVQIIALLCFNRPYGTTKNPHYLALYSAATLSIAVYCFSKASVKLRWLIGFSIFLLGAVILNTSSRPTWIGLIFSGFLVLLFLNRQSRNLYALSIVVILIGLILTNVGNFGARLEDLLVHLSTEERVVIWQDTWRMQSNSSSMEWIMGHGLNSFKEGFKKYSHYHLQNIDFNSPHNFILELLYISGIVGLLVATFMFWVIYKNILFGINSSTQNRNLYLVLLVVITSNFILVSITIPFFMGDNLNVIAIVTGVILYIRETSSKLMK